MIDNLRTIDEKFSLEVSDRFAAGSMYRCKKCGALAYNAEVWFPCQEKFIPTKICCNECRSRWEFKLELTEEEKALVKTA
jgi:hypothetical protein